MDLGRYKVKQLTEKDVEEIYQLCKENPLYYKYCPPFVTRESILEDLKVLPPKRSEDDKFYIGIYDKEQLCAVSDIIRKYPNEETVFIGFFMMRCSLQGKGIGSHIINELKTLFKEKGYRYIRLGYSKENPQSKAFWLKNGFIPTGVVVKGELYDIVVLEYRL